MTSTLVSEAPASDSAAIYQRIHPHSYLSKFLDEKIRPDGRSFDAFRPVNINTNSITTADGSALVRVGEMIVLCGIKAEVAEPDVMSPRCGFIIPNVDLPPLSSSKFKPGPPSDEAQIASQRIKSIIDSSGMLPLENLVIEPDKAVLAIYIDVTCINFDGNVVDAAMIAIVSALKETSFPSVTYNPDSGVSVDETPSRQKLPFRKDRITLCSTFIAFNSNILADPSSFEESVASSSLTIAVDGRGNVSALFQEGEGLTTERLEACIAAAVTNRSRIESMMS